MNIVARDVMADETIQINPLCAQGNECWWSRLFIGNSLPELVGNTQRRPGKKGGGKWGTGPRRSPFNGAILRSLIFYHLFFWRGRVLSVQ